MQAPKDYRRTGLALIALIAGGAVPIQLVTLSFGYAQYVQDIRKGPDMLAAAHDFAQYYIPFVYLPALFLLAGIGIYARKRYPGLCRRITVGFAMGAFATLALDAIRQMAVIHEWLPSPSPVMFGKMATGSESFSVYWPVGLAVHYLNGANFGLVYAFVFGKRRSYLAAAAFAIAWASILEILMMISPPMAPITGPFGINYAWPEMFVSTFVAHLFFGIALGLLIQHFLREEDRSWLVPFLLQRQNGGL